VIAEFPKQLWPGATQAAQRTGTHAAHNVVGTAIKRLNQRRHIVRVALVTQGARGIHLPLGRVFTRNVKSQRRVMVDAKGLRLPCRSAYKSSPAL